jgi:hypothetical protein
VEPLGFSEAALHPSIVVIDIVFFGSLVLGKSLEVERKRNSTQFLLAPAGAIV